jgi:hypothetical protein
MMASGSGSVGFAGVPFGSCPVLRRLGNAPSDVFSTMTYPDAGDRRVENGRFFCGLVGMDFEFRYARLSISECR